MSSAGTRAGKRRQGGQADTSQAFAEELPPGDALQVGEQVGMHAGALEDDEKSIPLIHRCRRCV